MQFLAPSDSSPQNAYIMFPKKCNAQNMLKFAFGCPRPLKVVIGTQLVKIVLVIEK